MGIKEEQRRLCEANTMHPDDDYDAPACVVRQRALELDYRETSLWYAVLRYASASSSNLVVRAWFELDSSSNHGVRARFELESSSNLGVRVPLELKSSSNMVARARFERNKKF